MAKLNFAGLLYIPQMFYFVMALSLAPHSLIPKLHISDTYQCALKELLGDHEKK